MGKGLRGDNAADVVAALLLMLLGMGRRASVGDSKAQQGEERGRRNEDVEEHLAVDAVAGPIWGLWGELWARQAVGSQ